MKWGKGVVYTALVLGGLLVAEIVVSLVVGLVWSLAWTVVPLGVALLVLGGLAYGGYALFSWLDSDGSASTISAVEDRTATATGTGGTDDVETIQKQYTNGDLSEAELERELERELGGPMESTDLESHRERE